MLTAGSRLGPYEIVAPLGAGGMGEVYRATDTHLGRGVAIKVLPDTLAHDVERVARLEHEARMLATLSHPNIAAIYGLEKSAGVHALVMELIEGPTLADRISSEAIEQDEAIAIARQIADALSAAHEQGITHRDLKPANVKVRPDGTVKVLDFGLAKAVNASPAPHHGLTRVRAGDSARAETILGKLDGANGAFGVSTFGSSALGHASFFVLCGEFDRAADYLDSLVDDHQPGLPFLLALPHFQSFRQTARGKQILRRMNLSD